MLSRKTHFSPASCTQTPHFTSGGEDSDTSPPPQHILSLTGNPRMAGLEDCPVMARAAAKGERNLVTRGGKAPGPCRAAGYAKDGSAQIKKD